MPRECVQGGQLPDTKQSRKIPESSTKDGQPKLPMRKVPRKAAKL